MVDTIDPDRKSRDDERRPFYKDVLAESGLASHEAQQKTLDAFGDANLSRLRYLADPLKRLQAYELGLLFGGVLLGFAWYFGWWIVVGILAVNEVVVGYKYFKERRAYVRGGGEL